MTRLRVLAFVAAAIAASTLAWNIASDDHAGLVIGDSVAPDLGVLAQDTFESFVSQAPNIADCIDRPRLEAAPDLEDLAQYDPATQTIFVRVPATAPNLEASLVHEFAHHLEQACASQRSIRAEFLVAQGHPRATEWFGDVEWADRPSEQFAEAVVEATLERRSRNQLRLQLRPDAIRVVSDWLTGDD